MKAIDIHGMTNMELVRGETDEWYWATDYIHGDLYEAEELFRQGHPVRSNRLYLIHYPDGTVYEAVSSTNRSRFGSDLCFLPPSARRIFHCFRPALPAPILFWVKNGSEKILKLQNKSCQAFVQYNFYHVDTRNLECGCRLSILRFRAP